MINNFHSDRLKARAATQIIKSLDNTYYSEISFEETKQMLHKETVQLLPMA